MRYVVLASLMFSNAAFSADVIIPKIKFVEEFKKGLPDAFCAEKTYFRKCFETTAEKCATAMSAAVTGCIASMDAKLPAQFKQPADGQAWGEKIGNCVGAKFETENAKGKKPTAECKDATKWK